MDTVRVKGKDQAITIYELLTEDSPLNRKNVAVYELALQHYRAGSWNKAITYLEQNIPEIDDDRPAQQLMNRCHELLSKPTVENWAAITTLNDK